MWNKLKTNRKKVILVLIIFIIFFLMFRFINKKQTVKLSPVSTSSSFFDKTKNEKLIISGVTINNIYRSEINTSPRGDTLFSQSSDYQILYFSQEQQFLISILKPPFEQKRLLAEKKFLQELGINEKDACLLDVVISTPSFANPKESGTNYFLSFCETEN